MLTALAQILESHGGGDSDVFRAWEVEVRRNPDLIKPSGEELQEHAHNKTAATDAVRDQPPGQAKRMKEIVAVRRRAMKDAWLYE